MLTRIHFVLIFWILGGGCAARSLTVASYNVENYTETNRLTEHGYRENYPKAEESKRALRQVIVALDADVLALQEMGSEQHLEELRRDLSVDGLQYAHTAWLEAADSERHLAVLSRIPILNTVRHGDLTYPWEGRREPVKRGLLEVEVAVDGSSLTLFVVHLKSRLSDDENDPLSQKRRSAEAEAIRDCILRRTDESALTRFLVAGDFNDSPSSRPLRAMRAKGKRTIAHLLPLQDDRGCTWTHCYKREGVYSTVDYILASPALVSSISAERSGVFQHPAGFRASDHRPLRIVLELPTAGVSERQ